MFGWQSNFLQPDIILPVGISFYTFQTLSYTIDIYRGKLKSTNNFIGYALFMAFFPQLVAGPIELARSLPPEIDFHTAATDFTSPRDPSLTLTLQSFSLTNAPLFLAGVNDKDM